MQDLEMMPGNTESENIQYFDAIAFQNIKNNNNEAVRRYLHLTFSSKAMANELLEKEY